MPYHRRNIDQLRTYLEVSGLAPMQDDLRFLVACLERIPFDAHDWAVGRYAMAWQQAMAGAEVEHLRHNSGRRAANSWLRSVLERKRLGVPDSAEMKQVRA